MKNKNIIQNILTPVLGFGLAGALWGWECYNGTVGVEYAITNPFSFILGAVYLGVFGSLSLVVFSRDIKKILKVVGLGIVGCLVGFLLPAIFGYWLWLFGGIITFIPELFVKRSVIEEFIILKPSLDITYLWLYFLLTGIIAGFFYSLILKVKKWSMIWRGGVGFALASLVSPVIGNLIGNLFNSLFLTYLITFFLIGGIFGLFLVWGILKTKNKNLNSL